MKFSEWKTVYDDILVDMGYNQLDDDKSTDILGDIMKDCSLVSNDYIRGMFGNVATIFGNASCLEDDLKICRPVGILIASGSSVKRIMNVGIIPDIIVTDLDGDIKSQIEANSKGAIAVIHAHGDNQDLIRKYAIGFKGMVMLTTQSVPNSIVSNFGGFTDGDRAVCLARHMGTKNIILEGFNFENPTPKIGTSIEIKAKKLKWAKKIIFDMNPNDINIIWNQQCP